MVSGTGGVIYDLHYIVHVLLTDSFLAQHGYFFLWEPLNQLEISALTECELKWFSWAFRAGVSSPFTSLSRAHNFQVPATWAKVASSKKRTQFKTRVHKPYPISDQNGRNWYPISDQNSLKKHTLWRSTYLYSLYKGLPHRGETWVADYEFRRLRKRD